MAGKQCPYCKEMTFFKSPKGRECSKCGTTVKTAANQGKGGSGMKCAICSEKTVFREPDGVKASCRTCGAAYTFPKP